MSTAQCAVWRAARGAASASVRAVAGRGRSARLAGWLSAALLLCGCAAPGQHAEPRLDAAQRERNVASFDVVWETVRDKHFDPQLSGVDWNAVRTELRPRVASAQTMSAARAVLNAALDRLRLSHFGIIPGNVYEQMGAGSARRGDGEVGLTLRVLDDAVTVVQVRTGQPAERAGVRPGWLLVEIDGQPVAPMVAAIRGEYAQATIQQHLLVAALGRAIGGPRDEVVRLGFADGADHPVTLELTRVEPDGARVQFGHLPAMRLRFESRRLEGGAGYIAFNLFFDPAGLMPQFEAAVEGYRDAPGIVLDLRGNPGGIGAMAMGMAGWFVDRGDQMLGTMRMRDSQLRFAVFPRAWTYAGRLAILVDGCTASTAEILAGGLQDLGRARVFGTRTAGAALPSQIVKLPNGDGFQFAIADYVSAGGRRLEHVGVTPDVEVVPTRAELLAGRDPVLEAAMAWIRSSAP